MPVEVFVYRGDNAPPRSLLELQQDLASAGVRCRIEELEDGPWLVLEEPETDMSIALDPDGMATSALVQCQDSPKALDHLFTAFGQLGWLVADEDA